MATLDKYLAELQSAEEAELDRIIEAQEDIDAVSAAYQIKLERTKAASADDLSFLTQRFENLLESETYLSIINSFSQALLEKQSVADVCWAISKNVISALNWEDCVIYLLDEDRQTLIQKAAYGNKNIDYVAIYSPIEIAVGQGIVGNVAQTGVAEIVDDVSLDKRYIVDDQVRASEITVPIVVKGKVIGIIDSEHSQPGFYTEKHLSILQTIASISATKLSEALWNESVQADKDELSEEVAQKRQDLEAVVEELKRHNAEKDVLLKEIHHRVKNNMQIINSLLRLQSNTIEDKNIRRVFSDSQNRIIAMALIHEQLYNSDDLSSINIRSYLVDLSRNLKLAYDISESVEIDYDIPDTRFDIQYLVPIGLIVNELLSNCLEHAFGPEYENPRIKMALDPCEDESFYQLTIEDNGRGMSADDFEDSEGHLGFELVRALADQLDGDIEFTQKDEGSSFRLIFRH